MISSLGPIDQYLFTGFADNCCTMPREEIDSVKTHLSVAASMAAGLVQVCAASASPPSQLPDAGWLSQLSDRQKVEFLSNQDSFAERAHDTQLGRLLDDDRRGHEDDFRHVGAVPEPSSWLLLSGGGAVLAVTVAMRRRRK